MAENETSQEKTEQPTERRKKQSREKGQVARSRELNTMISLVVGAAGLMFLGGALATDFIAYFKASLAIPGIAALDEVSIYSYFADAIISALLMLAPFFTLMILASVAGPLLMGGWSFSWQAIQFKVEKVDPLKGLKRIFSAKGLSELAKAILKVIMVGCAAYFLLGSIFDELLWIGHYQIVDGVARTSFLMAWFVMVLSTALILVVGFDVPFQLWDHSRQMKMSLQEVKEEMKDTDGRPEVKSKIRALQQQAAQGQMLKDVLTADVVITNPTHFSVAIRYDQHGLGAPTLVAKGRGEFARRIREVAMENNIELCSVPPLARVLYWNVDLGQEIPRNLYLAVAKVLAYVYQINAGMEGDSGLFDEIDIPEQYAEDLKK